MKISNFAISSIALSILSTISTCALAERVVIQVDNDKKGIVKMLAKQLGGEVKIDSDGFIAADFANKGLSQIKGLLNNPHIKLIESDPKRQLMSLYNDDIGDPETSQLTPYAVYQSQANQVPFDSSTGMKVCVIDSGLDHTNNDFDHSNITGSNDSGTGNWFDHGGPHGTHVAGTVGAADNNFGVIGMAPGVAMHIVKVFNAEGWGYSSDLAHAAKQCSDSGSNIISMSLGGGGANNTEENAFSDFVANGGLVVAAAGNDGNNVRSYPAGYSSVVMVGANDADNNIADFSQYPSCTTGRGKRQKTDETICVEVTAGGVDTLSTYPAGMATSSSMTADNVVFASSAMENSGSADSFTYYMGTAEAIDGNAAGAVCMIDRGNISFHDKVVNCQNSGGIGAVIINNVTGMLYGTLGSPNMTFIPALGAALEDRSALLAASNATVNIAASDYGFMSGTSMATPAVSGVAALVWSNFPSCTGEDIRAALKVTAERAGNSDDNVKFGYGIVKAKAAYDHLTTNGCSGDNGGGGDPSGDFTLSADGRKVKGSQVVDLSWSGTSEAVDVYRDGSVIAASVSGLSYTDNLNRKGGGSYSYQVCEAGTSTCSDSASVTF